MSKKKTREKDSSMSISEVKLFGPKLILIQHRVSKLFNTSASLDKNEEEESESGENENLTSHEMG